MAVVWNQDNWEIPGRGHADKCSSQSTNSRWAGAKAIEQRANTSGEDEGRKHKPGPPYILNAQEKGRGPKSHSLKCYSFPDLSLGPSLSSLSTLNSIYSRKPDENLDKRQVVPGNLQGECSEPGFLLLDVSLLLNLKSFHLAKSIRYFKHITHIVANLTYSSRLWSQQDPKTFCKI
jgi:hypothetical protein